MDFLWKKDGALRGLSFFCGVLKQAEQTRDKQTGAGKNFSIFGMQLQEHHRKLKNNLYAGQLCY
jgi:hypothetical protein